MRGRTRLRVNLSRIQSHMSDRSRRISQAMLRGFMRAQVAPRMPAEYAAFLKNGLIRMRGPFAQIVTGSIGRSGVVLKVHPIIYVAGASPSASVVTEEAGYEADYPNRWRFLEPNLDDALAARVVELLATRIAPSFVSSLSDKDLPAALKKFASDKKNWSASLQLAFLLLLMGERGAARQLNSAYRSFAKYGMLAKGQNREIDQIRDARFQELLSRAGSPECYDLCRLDAEAHAKQLNFPRIRWPEEWGAMRGD